MHRGKHRLGTVPDLEEVAQPVLEIDRIADRVGSPAKAGTTALDIEA